MRHVIIVLTILFVPLFFSSCNSAGNQFIGTWKNKQHDSIVINIKKEGGKFMVATLFKGKVSSTFPYELNENTLKPTLPVFSGSDDAIHMTSSGKLSWEGIEWDKLN